MPASASTMIPSKAPHVLDRTPTKRWNALSHGVPSPDFTNWGKALRLHLVKILVIGSGVSSHRRTHHGFRTCPLSWGSGCGSSVVPVFRGRGGKCLSMAFNRLSSLEFAKAEYPKLSLSIEFENAILQCGIGRSKPRRERIDHVRTGTEGFPRRGIARLDLRQTAHAEIAAVSRVRSSHYAGVARILSSNSGRACGVYYRS